MEYRTKYFVQKKGNKIQCTLCRHRCIISEGKLGRCNVRKNICSNLISLVYADPRSCTINPIEKKPFFHFFPGSYAFSFGSVGCNFRCLNCQNWNLSQNRKISEQFIEPEVLVATALAQNADGMSYTFNEPTIFFEYAYDVAKIAKEKGMYNMFVTNGYIEERPLRDISKYLDGANIDIKGFSESFYKKVCGSQLKKVLDSVKLYFKLGIYIELTYLIIPSYNDDEIQIREFVKWTKDELSDDVPIHFSRFFPKYKLKNIAPTPYETLEKARNMALNLGMKYVYLGNVQKYEDTYCPNCSKIVIKRHQSSISDYKVTKDKKCPFCGQKIKIVGNYRG